MLIAFNGFAQSYSSPESLEFDYSNNRWLISNKSANNILARSSSTGDLTIFASGITSPHGIEIANDTVYVCSGSTLKAYELNTGTPVFSINLGATYLNGITHDSTYLYITDFSAKVIYRFDMTSRSFTQYVTGLTKSPNGIIYDQLNNRCVFVNWGSNAPIMAFDLTTASVSTITPTSLGNCDGIAIDGTGNFYISSWNLNGISKFDNTFSTGPATVVSGLTNPADIFYNVLTDTLGVANSGSLSNTTYHFLGTSTSVSEFEQGSLNFSVNPNPISGNAEIKFWLKSQDHVKISLLDMRGQLIRTLMDRRENKGECKLIFNKSGLAAGNYFISITGTGMNETKRIILTD